MALGSRPRRRRLRVRRLRLGHHADVSRRGSFSRPQRRLYDAVLAAQKAALAAIRPGAPYDAAHRAAREVLLDACLDAGLLRGNGRARREERRAALLPPQRLHWLGLDVHDRGRYPRRARQAAKLEAGMVLTVEPGLYVRPDEKSVRRSTSASGYGSRTTFS